MAENIWFWSTFFERHDEIWRGMFSFQWFSNSKELICCGMLCHLVPLFCLLVDFSFNCIPIVWRHNMIFFFLSVSYAMYYSIDQTFGAIKH